MPKKKKIITGERYNPELDRMEVRFNRNATDKEIKQHIKENYSKLDGSQLPKEYAAYLGKVKGGHTRASKAARIDGKYLSEQFIQDGNYREIAKQLGYKNEKELFEKDREIYEAAKELMESPYGLPVKYGFEETMYKVDTFKGKIFINGKEYTKIKAIERLDKFDKTLKREHDIYYTEFWASYKHGGAELHFTLPSLDKVKNMDIDDLLNEMEEEGENSFEVIQSGRPEKEEEDREEIPEDKQERFKYKYVIMWKGKKKRGTIWDYNKDFAKQQLRRDFPKCLIISLKRAAIK